MSDSLDRLIELMARLRAPDGCPWDRKQTHESLKPYLLEETYEVLEAIDRVETHKLIEELGDVLLQVLFHAQIGAEAGSFSIDEVASRLAEKLVRRHPHVFERKEPNGQPLGAEQVLHRWEDIKRQEREQAGHPESALNGVPKTLPALLRAYQVQARASRVGFDWPHTPTGRAQVFEKILEEVGELRAASDAQTSEPPAQSGQARLQEEFGDVLFSLVNAARFLKVNPEDALRRAVDRFSERFQFIEQEARRMDRPIDSLTLEEMDGLWNRAKDREAGRRP
jgi:tetrapyrrole methylase family protein/MazG family protein